MAAALLCVLAGCATMPSKVTGPAASLEFNKGYAAYNGVGAGRAGIHFYQAVNDPRCPEMRATALTWTTPAMVAQPIDANRRLWIQAKTELLNSTGGGMLSRTCTQAFGFTPLAGHSYAVTQHAEASGCRLDIVDKATGAPPPDLLRTEASVPACQAYLGPGAS
ncbi:MAG TPA: hypothetical protein VEA44_03195 [Caulobacter sp.]|nr:hypothetical protein [Caulobacter sp.]